MVLKGNILYSKSLGRLEVREHGYLVYDDGVVTGVYQELPKQYQSSEIEDYDDKLIIPGLVDLHVHAPQYAFRGLGMDMELLDWLNKNIFPEEARMQDLEYAKESYRIFVDSLKRSATTRACIFATIHRAATMLLMDMLETSGLATMVGKVNMDRNSPEYLCEESAEASAFDTVEWIKDVLHRKYKNTQPILTPRFIPCCTDELMEKLKMIQMRYELPVQSHLSENPIEIELVKELCPESKFYGDAYDIFEEAFYLATKGGGSFFGKVGSFESGYEMDAVILDDTRAEYPQELSVKQRLERMIYFSDDREICAKYVRGNKIYTK